MVRQFATMLLDFGQHRAHDLGVLDQCGEIQSKSDGVTNEKPNVTMVKLVNKIGLEAR